MTILNSSEKKPFTRTTDLLLLYKVLIQPRMLGQNRPPSEPPSDNDDLPISKALDWFKWTNTLPLPGIPFILCKLLRIRWRLSGMVLSGIPQVCSSPTMPFTTFANIFAKTSAVIFNSALSKQSDEPKVINYVPLVWVLSDQCHYSLTHELTQTVSGLVYSYQGTSYFRTTSPLMLVLWNSVTFSNGTSTISRNTSTGIFPLVGLYVSYIHRMTLKLDTSYFQFFW